jgi:hypothetical protein
LGQVKNTDVNENQTTSEQTQSTIGSLLFYLFVETKMPGVTPGIFIVGHIDHRIIR